MKVRGRKSRKRGGTSDYGTSKRLWVLTAIDRNKNFRMNITGIGNPTGEQIIRAMDPWVLKQKNKRKKSILCTDGSNSYWALAKRKNLTYYKIPGYDLKWTKPKVYHLQHVNNTHSKLKEWIRIFHGVSDKYMRNYLTYFRIMEIMKKYDNQNQIYREFTLLKNYIFMPTYKFDKYYKQQLYSI